MKIRGRLARHTDGAIIQIELPPLPPAIEFSGRTFAAKRDYHVSLLGREILRRAGLSEMPAREDAIRRAARGKRFSIELLDDFWLLREGEAATLIRVCAVDGAEEFFRHFESEAGVIVDRPPYHITLYTHATDKGVGLCSVEDLRRLGRRLDADESGALLRLIT